MNKWLLYAVDSAKLPDAMQSWLVTHTKKKAVVGLVSCWQTLIYICVTNYLFNKPVTFLEIINNSGKVILNLWHLLLVWLWIIHQWAKTVLIKVLRQTIEIEMNTAEENAFTQNILPFVDKYLKAHNAHPWNLKGWVHWEIRRWDMWWAPPYVSKFIYFFSFLQKLHHLWFGLFQHSTPCSQSRGRSLMVSKEKLNVLIEVQRHCKIKYQEIKPSCAHL